MKKRKSNWFLLLWYSYPRIAVALMLLALNLFVIILFTIILSVLSGNGFMDELSYLFTYTMCSDGIYDFVNDQEDVACFVVKIILTVTQMVIFSGALIGFTTDVIQNTFDSRLENKGKMYLKDHYVFLNWSTIGQNIIHDLAYLEGEKIVVILAEQDREEILHSIDNIFIASGQKRKGLRIFVKKGSPTSSKYLDEISISEARHIGVLLPNCSSTRENEISEKDLTAFKTMLSIVHEASHANIVVETENEAARKKIEALIAATYPKDNQKIAVFSHNSVMGHVLGRTTINPDFAPLIHHVLSFEGVEFYGIPTMDLEEALYTYNDCIPVVNYDDDEATDALGNKAPDQLYVLNDNEQSLGIRREKKSFARPMAYRENIQAEAFTLFVFSNSNRAQFAISELDNYNLTYHANIRYSIFSYDDNVDEIIQKIQSTPGKRKILMLSEEGEDTVQQDTAVFLLLLHLKTSAVITEDVDIYVEIANIDNMVPVRNLGIASIILTNKIISLYMLQLLTHGQSKRFFKDILLTNSDTGDIDFEIIPAGQLLVFEEDPLVFSCYAELVQSFFLASGKRKMLLGYFPEGAQQPAFFCNEMDQPRTIEIKPNDRLILVAYSQ